LGELGASNGPGPYPTFVWFTHRIQRDALYREAAGRGLAGWLAPPVAFFSDLPQLFGIDAKPIGSLRRRAVIGRLARELGSACGIGGALPERTGVVQALGGLFGELLPEGVAAERLEELLQGIGADDFARCRNDWVSGVYRGYLAALTQVGAYDPRQIHSLVAEQIAAGRLSEVLAGARKLHIYGLTSLRTRRQLIDALAVQTEVEVTLYLPAPDERGPEEDEFGRHDVEALEGEAPGDIVVQPAPDARRELDWVACEIKRLLLEHEAEPDTIAVVARTGREDTRPAYEALRAAGIPATARIRTTLAEVPALKAILHLFRGAAAGWRYRSLRTVLESAYFDTGVDLRPIDYIGAERRVDQLDHWALQMCRLQEEAARQEKRGESSRRRGSLSRLGIWSSTMDKACETFDAFRLAVVGLSADRSIATWIEATQKLLDPGLFGFRERACRFDAYDYEIVRLDQQGIDALRRSLDDWSGMLGDEGLEEVGPEEWYARLRRFLESNEITLLTPRANGVRVLEAHEAALFPFEHVYVIHANDGQFPKAMRPGGLFSEEERVELAERGLPIAHRELSLRRERALWRAVTRNEHVTVTYRTADLKGTPLLPSLLVPEHKDADAIPRTQFLLDVPLNRAQTLQKAANDLADAHRQGETKTIEVVRPALLRQAVLAAFVETQRRAGDDREAGMLGPWNGELRDPWLLDWLGRRFGDDYRWSASKLESYASCPFPFLVNSVLRLDEREEAEEETTRLIYGSVAHEILERFYKQLGPDYPDELDGDAEALFEEICYQVFDRWQAQEKNGEYLGVPALWAVTRASIHDDVKDYVCRELPHMAKKGERPIEFEYEFGFGDEVVVISGVDAQGVKRTMQVCGKIDRVDEVNKGKHAGIHILDYKSGRTGQAGGYDDGSTLQIPLYMKVLAEAKDYDVTFGRYRTLKRAKGISNAAGVDWDSPKFVSALKYVFSIPGRVRAGKFEAKVAAASGWQPWDPGIDVCRTRAQQEEGSRFDPADTEVID
jgi:ATP-dependent helicase/DNAse subunit B